MKNLFSTFLYFIICSLLSLYIYSCNCECYDDFNIIRVDTVRKQVSVGDTGPYMVQIGAFLNKDNADNFAIIARSKLNTSITVRLFSDGIYRILSGEEFDNAKSAEVLLDLVKKSGYIDAIIRDSAGPVK